MKNDANGRWCGNCCYWMPKIDRKVRMRNGKRNSYGLPTCQFDGNLKGEFEKPCLLWGMANELQLRERKLYS